jgi:hypothetical protein
MRNAYKVLIGNDESKRPLEDLGIDGRVILKWIFENSSGRMRTGLGTGTGSSCGIL